MPRLSPALFRQARAEHSLLARLLLSCRTLDTARNELRWLREHAISIAKSTQLESAAGFGRPQWSRHLIDLVKKRARGWPLQYVLGTEFFGDLELACRPGVLIPR